ncbi:MAG: glycosyltransferase family 4 protein [Chloroflexi bacterium]|nr:glycosyltransferase family 4 protein [Chloroflexota bacterium]
MKILEVLTYYRPWISGLTIYVERLSRALARQGHDVTVLTSQYDPNLPRYDLLDSVKVVRVPVAFRVSKGVIMPSFGPTAWKLAQKADVIHLHLPQFDAPGVAMRGRVLGKPVVITYHSDLQLPSGLFNRTVDRVVHFQNRMAGALADAIVTYTRDFGSHSPYLSQYLGQKLHIIPPPVELTACPEETANQFRQKHKLNGQPIIGIICRLAAEKGVELLLKALPIIHDQFPNAHVLHAGPYKDILGEEAYAARLAPLFEQYKSHYHLLGSIEGAELTAFYKSLDCLTIPSLNNTETFGLVQIEAMMNGVPSVASALPGVRQPVTMTGMGEIIPIGDHEALAQAIIRILSDKQAYLRDSDLIRQSFSPDETAVSYINLFNNLQKGIRDSAAPEPPAYERLRAMRDKMTR